MENEDDSLVHATGHDGALKQEGLSIPFQGQVHGSLPDEPEVRPQPWVWVADLSSMQSPSFKWVTPPLARQDPSPLEGASTEEGENQWVFRISFITPSHLDVPAFILIGVSAVHNHKPLHDVVELACQQGHHL